MTVRNIDPAAVSSIQRAPSAPGPHATAGGPDFVLTEQDRMRAVLRALAVTTGAAIANARRLAESEQRRRWLAASGELTSVLLSGAAAQPATLIAQHAAAAAEADFAVLWDGHEAGQAIVTGVSGALAAGLLNRAAPLADSPAGQAIRTGQPSLVTGHRREAAGAALGADIGSLIVVPLAAGGRIRGALELGRLATGPEFTGIDLDMAASLASHAAVALELIEARADQIILARVEDHDRIAAELHDHVIQELFALGMRLQGHAGRGDLVTAQQINGYAGSLDEIIRKIRTSIFGLRRSQPMPGGLHTQLLEIVDQHTPQLGFSAAIRFAGPLERAADAALTQDILAVTREALSNCARHAHASTVSISLALEGGLITLDVTDNGRGLGIPTRSSGLANMRHRAERNGGTLQLTTPRSGGTQLTWTGLQRWESERPRASGGSVNLG
jgi:signal transduction histidine kinase